MFCLVDGVISTSGELLGVQGGYSAQVFPVNLEEDQNVNPRAVEPGDATEEGVSEKAALAASIEPPENDAAIENLNADGK